MKKGYWAIDICSKTNMNGAGWVCDEYPWRLRSLSVLGAHHASGIKHKFFHETHVPAVMNKQGPAKKKKRDVRTKSQVKYYMRLPRDKLNGN